MLLERRAVAGILAFKQHRAMHGLHSVEEEKEMKRLTLILAAAGAIATTPHAFASDWKAQPLSAKRQMVSQVISCMKRRMSGDRLISYNQASKECRESVEGQLEKSTSGPLVASVTGAGK
jgi:hypothetical protein